MMPRFRTPGAYAMVEQARQLIREAVRRAIWEYGRVEERRRPRDIRRAIILTMKVPLAGWDVLETPDTEDDETAAYVQARAARRFAEAIGLSGLDRTDELARESLMVEVQHALDEELGFPAPVEAS